MSTTVTQDRRNRSLESPGLQAGERELLNKYIALSASKRRNLFAPTGFMARRFGIPQRTLQRWIEAGVVPALRIGRNYKIHVPSLELYLQECNRFEE
jgi:excisionase family DNA binding protein